MKNNSRKFSTLVSLFSVLSLSITATFAWFYMNSDVEVDYGSEIECQTGTSLEVSMLESVDEEGNETWSGFSSKVKKSNISAKLQDITGNGENLYKVISLRTDENGDLYPDGLKKASPTDEAGYGDYIELNIQLRSTSKMDVYFGGESFVLPVSESVNDQNIFGDFSKDYIAGAMRVAVLEKQVDESLDLKMVWAPNPNYQLIRDKEKGTYTFTKEGIVEQYKYYKCVNEENEEFELYNVSEDDLVEKRFIIGSTNTNDKMINNSPLITSINPDASTVFGLSESVIRICFEGTDREADQALSGGRAKMNLVFSGIETKSDAKQESITALNTVKATLKTEGDKQYYDFSGMNNTMYFSTDGYNWKQYQEEDGTNNLPDILTLLAKKKRNVYLYIKIPETDTNKEVIRKMEFIYKEEVTVNE